MSSLRSDLTTGIKNPNCQACWQAESLGKESLRQGYNNLLRPYVDFGQLRDNIKNNNFNKVALPSTWELDVGNLCNLKCIMCDPIKSDKILAEVLNNESKFQKFPTLINQAKQMVHPNWLESASGQDFINMVKPNIKWLKLQGGEALTIKGIRDLIESLDNQNVTLSITTNGTVLDQRLLESLSKFLKVEISISVEAIGTANDVIRYGSSWEIIQNNINLLTKYSNIDLQLNHVLQNTSVLFLPDIIKFAEQHKLHLSVLRLHDPKYLSLLSIPTIHIDRLIEQIEHLEITNQRNKEIKNYLKNIRSSVNFDPELHKQFQQYVSTLDQIRSEKLTPWLKPILDTL
jgi:MoaA/NifB/PqqE/SkfB family radical SAM enzyme